MKLSEPETFAEEDRERAIHRTGITAVVSESIGEESEDGLFRFYKKCPHCGDSARRTFEEHDAHKAECWEKIKDNAPSQEEIAAKVAEAFPIAAEMMKRYKGEAPEAQKYIVGMNQCRRVLGRNMLVGKIMQYNDVMHRGILIPADVRKYNQSDFEEIHNASTFVRIIRVSETRDDDVYPWLKEYFDMTERGQEGPVCELIPNSGVKRYSDTGEEYRIFGAANIWVEYPEPKSAEEIESDEEPAVDYKPSTYGVFEEKVYTTNAKS